MDSITLSSYQRGELADHAARCLPNEACAILLGRYEGKAASTSEVLALSSQRPSRTGFIISNIDLLKSYNTAEEKGLDVIGIFHSHPDSPAVPSNTDEKFMIINPVAWLIQSGVDGGMRAYVYDHGIQEITLVLN